MRVVSRACSARGKKQRMMLPGASFLFSLCSLPNFVANCLLCNLSQDLLLIASIRSSARCVHIKLESFRVDVLVTRIARVGIRRIGLVHTNQPWDKQLLTLKTTLPATERSGSNQVPQPASIRLHANPKKLL